MKSKFNSHIKTLLELKAQGLSNKKAGEKLGLSLAGVHRWLIKAKQENITLATLPQIHEPIAPKQRAPYGSKRPKAALTSFEQQDSCYVIVCRPSQLKGIIQSL